jgi:hypothetical protein
MNSDSIVNELSTQIVNEVLPPGKEDELVSYKWGCRDRDSKIYHSSFNVFEKISKILAKTRE